VPSVVIGYLAIGPMLFGDFFKDSIFVNGTLHPAMTALAEEFHGPVAMALHGLQTAPFWLALAGVALSYYMYMVNPALPAAIKRTCSPIYTLLENKYYLDWFNENVLAKGARGLGFGLWKGGLGGRCGASPAKRLHLPLRAGHDHGCTCAHDVFRLVQQVGWEKKKNGIVEPCDLDADLLRRRTASLGA
jgi:hypothetical protein